MKHIKRITLQDACPKCGSHLEFEETTWDSMSGSLVSVLCCKCKVRGENSNNKAQAFERFEKKLALKEKREREKPEKILTDIRDYLVAKAELVRERDMEFLGQSAMLQLLAIEQKELKEYAKKFGVDL